MKFSFQFLLSIPNTSEDDEFEKERCIEEVLSSDDQLIFDYDNSLFIVSVICTVVNPIFGIPAIITVKQGEKAFQQRKWRRFEILEKLTHALTCIGFFTASVCYSMLAIKLYHVIFGAPGDCFEKCSFLTNSEFDRDGFFRSIGISVPENNGRDQPMYDIL